MALSTGDKVALLGAILAVIGPFLSWVSVGNMFQFSGIDIASGIAYVPYIALLFGLIVLANTFVIKHTGLRKPGTAILGIISLVLVLYGWSVISNAQALVSVLTGGLGAALVSIGIGFYITLLAALLVLIGGALMYRETA